MKLVFKKPANHGGDEEGGVEAVQEHHEVGAEVGGSRSYRDACGERVHCG